MRKSGMIAGTIWLAVAVVLLAAHFQSNTNSQTSVSASAAEERLAHMPAVFKPENTPIPEPTIIIPTRTPTPTPTASPTPGGGPGGPLVNGSFEAGWTNMPPAPGNLINQQPNGWTLTWLPIGAPIWDDANATAQGVPECLHKLAGQLPPNEQPGGPNALILDGQTTYKMFHFGAPFGSQLYQRITSLPPGSTWRLTVPVQVHMHGDSDPWAAEAGVWALTSEEQTGGWVPGGTMGDRQWYNHVVEFQIPADGTVEVLLRVKSKWSRSKDFFTDAIRLEQISNLSQGPHRQLSTGQALWLPRVRQNLPEREIVRP
jgi:hypothetical protein